MLPMQLTVHIVMRNKANLLKYNENSSKIYNVLINEDKTAFPQL